MRTLRLALILGVLGASPLLAEEEVVANQDFLNMKKELDDMLSSRSLDVFELDFTPLAMDRILVRNRDGLEEEYHYLTFRLINRVSDNTQYLLKHTSRYNEVLKAITEQFQAEQIKLKVDPDGARLSVEGVAEAKMGVIVERADLRVLPRRVNLTATVWDENGSRIRFFDQAPYKGPQERFDFADQGAARQSSYSLRVKEAIEERVGRRLRTVNEIRTLDIPPYDAKVIDAEGVAKGMIYGVFIFDRLPVEGDTFMVQVNGLSNKLRFRTPNHERNQIADYFNARVLRRTYVMTFDRIGDEYYHDLDPFILKEHGWRWLTTFQRLRLRKTKAYLDYYFDNIRLEEERSRRQSFEYSDFRGDEARKVQEEIEVPVLHDEKVRDDFWNYSGDVRTREVPGLYQSKQEGLNTKRTRVQSYYEAEMAQRKAQEEERPVRARLQERLDEISERLRAIEQTTSKLPEKLPDNQPKAEKP